MSSNILQFNGSHADVLGPCTDADDKWVVLCEVRIVPDVGRKCKGSFDPAQNFSVQLRPSEVRSSQTNNSE